MSNLLKRMFPILLVAGISFTLHGQVPACVSVYPEDATVWDDLTLTFYPDSACYNEQSLVGVPQVYMHSGVALLGGAWWTYLIWWNSFGANGQYPILWPNGDGSYSINFNPSEFYGIPYGSIVTHLCIVFNDGTWFNEGRDFDEYGNCIDVIIPLNYEYTNPVLMFKLNMNYQVELGMFDPLEDAAKVEIFGQDIHFMSDEDGDGIYSVLVEDLDTVEYTYTFLVNDISENLDPRVIDLHIGYNEVSHWFNDEFPPEELIIADFENGTSGSLIFHPMGNGPYTTFESFTIIENPDTTGLNKSNLVTEFLRAGAQNNGLSYAGFWADCYPLLDVSEFKFVHVKVWKPRFSTIKFKLENGTSGTLEIESSNPQTTINAWEDFVFDFSSMDGTYPIVAFMPDYYTPPDEDIIIYFDDILINNIPEPLVVGTSAPLLSGFSLQGIPNPFSQQVTVVYYLPGPGSVCLTVFDILGNEIAKLTDGQQTSGRHEVQWDPEEAPAGIYFAGLKTPYGQEIIKLIRH